MFSLSVAYLAPPNTNKAKCLKQLPSALQFSYIMLDIQAAMDMLF
jgi:hypothetical protein